MTRVAAVEYASPNVRINAICPGIIATPMAAVLGPNHPTIKAAIDATPFGRLGVPVEVANLALILGSDESSYITGAAVPVDGGYGAI